jgi:LmbE family N-acetylglucosaminyl deacetylase
MTRLAMNVLTLRKLQTFLVVAVFSAHCLAAPPLSGSSAIRKSLDRLTHYGSVLMIAAHPDDENTSVLAYLALGRGVRTGYLSLTRGEGGQNLIGPEQGVLLGVIRTQELLAARRIDGAEQYFTRAIDFGFSKTPQESIAKWGHDEVLSDIVWVIRKFRPDVVLLQWTGTPRDGHGHHQASAILAREAIKAAADAGRFPDQLKYVMPWNPRHVMEWARNATGPGLIELPVGAYDPILGMSYTEIAGLSRSMHHSQGQGTPQRRGASTIAMRNLGPENNLKDIFDGIDLSWKRRPGGEELGALLERAAREFKAADPTAILPLLIEARTKLAPFNEPDAKRRLSEIDETIAMITGLWIDVNMTRPDATPGTTVERRLTALNRSNVKMETAGSELPFNTPITQTIAVAIPANAAPTQPYWLREPPSGNLYTIPDQQLRGIAEPLPRQHQIVNVRVNGTEIALDRPIWNRYVDEVLGELTRPFVVEPAVTLRIIQGPVVFPVKAPKTITVEVQANADAQSGTVHLATPAGWTATPASRPYTTAKAGEITAVEFQLNPPEHQERVQLQAIAETASGAKITSGKSVISYPHIPQQTVFDVAQSIGVRADVHVLAEHIGYVMGTGDEGPSALRQMGCDVTLLGPDDLAQGNLQTFDAIVTGVRAYNTRADLRANNHRLLDYVNAGGTLVVQYNTATPGLVIQGPYPVTFSRDRVTVEDAPVTMLNRDSPVLHTPNEITEADFAGWVQERGLYFASQWDPKYTPIFQMNDPDEKPMSGSTLVTKYGKGVYVFTALSFFRQLPAGVPGAYRLFANLVSAGKTIR